MGLPIILFAGAVVILLWLYLWSLQRQKMGNIPEVEEVLVKVPTVSGDAVLVAREHGKIVHANEVMRHWLNLEADTPNLEYVASVAQPSDTFFELFTREMQASFQLNRRWVQATSHFIPSGGETRIVVIFRELAHASSTDAPEAFNLATAINLVDEIGTTINASLGVEQVLLTLLTIVRKHIAADAGEVSLYDENAGTLTPRGWAGDFAYVLALSEQGGLYQFDEGITGWIARYQKPVLVADVNAASAVQPKLGKTHYQSFVGLPLLMGDRLLGTFELAAKEPGHFSQADFSLLQAVSSQLATAIYNAELYTQQTQRIEDLASLQGLSYTSGDPEETYAALTERIARLLNAQICGFLLYNELRHALVAEPPFFGLPVQLVRSYAIAMPEGSPQYETWMHSPYWSSNDLSDGESLAEAFNQTMLMNAAGVINTVLMPLEVGSRRIGILQVANKRSQGGFGVRDIQQLNLLTAQAAVIVEEIRLAQQELDQEAEMAGLQEIAQAFGEISHESEFFTAINDRISRMFNVEYCGVLLYNAVSNRLVAQTPYFGMTDEVAQGYVIDLPEDSPLTHIWNDEDYWFTNNVQTDKIIHSAGLADFMATLDIRQTILATLASGGRRIGSVQLSNRRDRADFSDKDARLLLIFASQIAGMIENTRLFQEAQGRAEESERLRRIAELAGAIMAPDDDFSAMLAEVAALTNSPSVFVSLFDADKGRLVTYQRNTHNVPLVDTVIYDTYSKGMEHSVAVSRRPFISNDIQNDPRALENYKDAAQKYAMTTICLVPLVVGDHSLGEMGVVNRVDPPYSSADLTLLQGVTVQIAAALDRVRLYEATGHNLSRRLQELDAISRVSNELALTLDLDRVLDVIRFEAIRATDAQGSTVALLLPPSEWRKPDEPRMDRRLGERIAVGLTDVELAAINNGTDALIVEDYARSTYHPAPDKARSAIAAAFTYEERVVGVIHLYHDDPAQFDNRAATFLMTLAAKASLSYGNNLRYLENKDRSDRLRRRVDQLNQIFELGQMLQSTVDPVMMLEAIAYSVQQSCGFDVVMMTMLEGQTIRRVAQAGLPIDAFEASKKNTLPRAQLAKLFEFQEYNISESYFLPFERVTQWYLDGLETFNANFAVIRTMHPRGKNDWHDGDMLLIPIHGAGGDLLGVMSLDRPFDGLRPDRALIEILEIFAHQAAAMLENTRLYLTSTRSAEQEAQLNEVMEAITATLDIPEIVESVARGLQRILPFARLSMALLDSEQQNFDLVQVAVQPDETLTVGRDRRSSLARTALGRSFDGAQDYLYLASDAEMNELEDLRNWATQGQQVGLVMPLVSGGTTLGALHIGGDDLNQLEAFEEHRALLKRIANLTAIAVQNARLFSQAVNLRFFNESVVESIQQGIIVLDRSGRVLTVNEFMRARFNWGDASVREDLFAYRPSLRFLADTLRVVTEKGVPQALINQTIREDGKNFVLNLYLYPLRAADAVRGAVLLIDDVTDRARLEQDIAARAAQLAALTEISSRITAALRRDEVIALAFDEMQNVIGYDVMSLWWIEGEEVVLEAARGYEPQTGGTRVLIASHDRLRRVADTQRSVTINHLQGWDVLPGEAGHQSWLGVPLMRQAQVVGMITLCVTQPAFYDAQAEQAALVFANQLAVALVNADLFEEATMRTQRLSLLNRVSVALAQSLDNENILEVALREISETLGIDRAKAYLFERETNVARLVVERPRGDLPPYEVLDLKQSVVFSTMSRHPEPILISDLNTYEDRALVDELRPRGLVGYAAIPMTVGGQTSGMFEMEIYDVPHKFDLEKLDLALIIANQAAIAVLNANLLEQTLVRTRELETLLEAAQATSYTLDLEEVFGSVVRLILQALDMDDCAIMMYDNVEDMLKVEYDLNRQGDESRITPAGTAYDLKEYPAKMRAVHDGQILVIRHNDPNADPRELEEMERAGDTARMLVPLIVRDQAIGLLQIELQSEFRTFTHRETRMAQALAAQAAISIENARLSTETAAQVEQSLVINDLSRAISSTMDVNDMIRIVREQVPQLTDAEEMYMALYNAETQDIIFPMAVRSGKDYTIASRKLGSDEVSFVIKYRRPLPLGGESPTATEVRRNLGITNGEDNALRYLGVPLIAGDQVVGVLAVRDTQQKRPFGLNDQRILTTIGAQLGATIQNARLFQRVQNFATELNQRVEERTLELQQERDRIDSLYQIAAELGRTLDTNRVLDRALDMVAKAINAEDAVVLLFDPLTDRLYSHVSLATKQRRGGTGRLGDVERRYHPAEMLANWAINNSKAVNVGDLQATDYWQLDNPGAENWRSGVAVVLETNEDVQGVMVFLSTQLNHFTEPQLKLAGAAASQVAAAVNNADLYNLIRDQNDRMATLLRAEQEEAEKNSAILEGIADGVMLADASGVVILFNSAAEAILGLRRDYVLGQPLSRLTGTEGSATWTSALNNWSLRSRRPDEELILDRVDVGRRIVNVHASPVYTGDQVLGTVAVFRDVTKETEVDRMKSEFISNVSHELRTPMTSIMGYVDLMLKGAGGDVNEQQRQFLSTIRSNATRLSNLVNDLLNISKLDSGRDQLTLSEVNVQDVIVLVASSLRGRSQYQNKAMTVDVKIAPDLPLIRGDRDKLTQVVSNLADNAFNYSHAGGNISIEAQAQPDGKNILIQVRDNGIGIPEQFRERIWNRFERYEEHALVMDVAGTGLGLSIVKTLVDMHQGEVWFETEVNKGTTFYISLPIAGPQTMLSRITAEEPSVEGQ